MLFSKVETIKSELSDARLQLQDLKLPDVTKHVEGLLTCGIIALAHIQRSLREEVREQFMPKGISRSHGVCFVCGAAAEASLMVRTTTQKSGAEIVSWFAHKKWQGAYLDENCIIHIGSCFPHLHALKHLSKLSTLTKSDVEVLIENLSCSPHLDALKHLSKRSTPTKSDVEELIENLY